VVELVIIAVYLLGMLVIGFASRKRTREADSFFVAGRKSSASFVTGSLLATIIGGSATVGMAGLGFTRGLTGAWWLLAGSAGLIVLGVFFARKVRKLALYTLPELVESQYGRGMSLASALLITLSWIAIVAAQIIAAGKILGILGMGNPVLWMTIFSVVFITYTAMGGQYAILRTDSIQAVIIFAGIFAGISLLLSRLGGLAGMQVALPAGHFDFPTSPGFDTPGLVSMLLVVGLTYVVGPDMYSRIFCARDESTARTATLWTAALIVPIALAITLMGMGAAILSPGIAPEQAFPQVIKELFPPLLGGIVLAALLCAVMSSADTTLLSASTILMVDIAGWFKPSLRQRKLVPHSRWTIVVLGLCSLVVALVLKGVISALLFAYTIYTAGVIMPVLFGFFRERLRITSAGALAALTGGGALGLVSKLVAVQYLDLGAIALSALLLFGVSFVHNKIKGR
jgi:SSS family solute:Na+ symporter